MDLTVAHPLSDLSHVLSVFPAGEHVGEGERLQTSVNQIRLLGLLLILLWRRTLVHLFRPQKMLPQGFCHRILSWQRFVSLCHNGASRRSNLGVVCFLETTFLRYILQYIYIHTYNTKPYIINAEGFSYLIDKIFNTEMYFIITS